MISVIYWIANIILSLVFESWTLFWILGLIWVIWMILRGLAKNGVFSSDGGDVWLFTDIEESVNDGFGGGDFGGGGGSGDWGDSGDSGGDGGD